MSGGPTPGGVNPDQLIGTIRALVEATQQTAKNIASTFPQQTGTAPSATGGSASLPSSPVGFLTVTLPNGTAVKVPYYGA